MAAEGQIIPDLKSRVDPAPHLVVHWNAFWELSTERQIGMGLGPIPWTAIVAYARELRFDDDDERERFRGLIRAMDGEYLKWRAEQGK